MYQGIRESGIRDQRMELWFLATFFSFPIFGLGALVVNPDEEAAGLYTKYLLNHAESKDDAFENTF